jgi:hypothetical protein
MKPDGSWSPTCHPGRRRPADYPARAPALSPRSSAAAPHLPVAAVTSAPVESRPAQRFAAGPPPSTRKRHQGRAARCRWPRWSYPRTLAQPNPSPPNRPCPKTPPNATEATRSNNCAPMAACRHLLTLKGVPAPTLVQLSMPGWTTARHSTSGKARRRRDDPMGRCGGLVGGGRVCAVGGVTLCRERRARWGGDWGGGGGGGGRGLGLLLGSGFVFCGTIRQRAYGLISSCLPEIGRSGSSELTHGPWGRAC